MRSDIFKQFFCFTSVYFFLLILIFIGFRTDSCKFYGHDCQDYLDRGHKTSGMYYLTPVGAYTGMSVYCDMTTDGGGWLVSIVCFAKQLGQWHKKQGKIVCKPNSRSYNLLIKCLIP